MSRKRTLVKMLVASSVGGLLAGLAVTYTHVSRVPPVIPPVGEAVKRVQFTARDGERLSVTYGNDWNVFDTIALHEVPDLLRDAFVLAEDKRFFSHGGNDFRAIAGAAVADVKARRIVRGASTITEQSARILTPRPRTFFSRFLEAIEARRLEQRFSKYEILEFYLNQVPYASNRRGIVQAASMLFDRDLSTLNDREMLGLAVLVRAPSLYDPRKTTKRLAAAIERLGDRMVGAGTIDREKFAGILKQPLGLRSPSLPIEAPHFIRYVSTRNDVPAAEGRVRTTLEPALQGRLQMLVDRRVRDLSKRKVSRAALLAVDNATGNVLAWVNSRDPKGEVSHIDSVLTPRQPGSTLKPFLYALAIEKGWTAATMLDDQPLARPVGFGIHRFRNYSGAYYGPVLLRDALGNSLNIPAVLTAQFVSNEAFLARLHDLGFTSLQKSADFYGEGLALGAGEVSLYELVRAYLTLGRGGELGDLQVFAEPKMRSTRSRVSSRDATAIIADILSDPNARTLEFGQSSVLELPVRTAVKTGTSTDYRDAWALGVSGRYTAGVWMGNLDRSSMEDVTGSTGPALLLRAAFAELERRGEPSDSVRPGTLVSKHICRLTGLAASSGCPEREEIFVRGSEPAEACDALKHPERSLDQETIRASLSAPRLRLPTPGLHIALDPRIPDALEAFPFQLEPTSGVTRTSWYVDSVEVGVVEGSQTRFLWHPERGHHYVRAEVSYADGRVLGTEPIGVVVK